MGNTFGKSSTFTWDNLLDFILAIGTPQVEIVLLKQQPLPDPCILLNNNIINVATELAKSGEKIAYITGYGDCVHCKKPNFYTLASSSINMQPGAGVTGGWVSQLLPDRKDIANVLRTAIDADNLNYIYLLLGDNNLNVINVKSVYRLQNSQFIQLPGCNPTSRKDIVPTNSTNWLIILIIIILFIFLLIY